MEVYLTGEGYKVFKFYNPLEALLCTRKEQISLAVLDVMMPDMDGFTLLQKIRESYFFPVIMLTAKIEDSDKITGLDLGADDYITKPFNPLEVVARVKTQLRRFTKYNTELEFDILWYLCGKKGKVVSSEELFEAVWKEKYLDSNNTVMAHIARLREKLGEPARNPKYIKTVWGVGYTVE